MGPLICSAFWGRRVGGGVRYSYWNYMPFKSLGDKDGGYISASYMNDWVDKEPATSLKFQGKWVL